MPEFETRTEDGTESKTSISTLSRDFSILYVIIYTYICIYNRFIVLFLIGVGFNPFNIPSPGLLIKSIGIEFFERVPILASTGFQRLPPARGATLTHYSTEQLTTGSDFDPLLLLLALAGDVHPNP